MRSRTGAIIASAVAPLLAGLIVVASSAQARDRLRDRYADDLGWGPSVGRNAPEAIASGLAGQSANWIDTMANFYADPRLRNRAYFDDYRRPYDAWGRTGRRR